MTAENTTLFRKEKDASIDYYVLVFQDGLAALHLYHPNADRSSMISLCAERKYESGVEILNLGPRSKHPEDGMIHSTDGSRRVFKICENCEKHRKRGDELYAIAIEEFVRGKWETAIEYAHGKNSHEVASSFSRANSRARRLRIVACGPAIGFHVANDAATVLIA